MLDAGHGGFDNGAMFNGRKEKKTIKVSVSMHKGSN